MTVTNSTAKRRASPLVVFSIRRREGACDECGTELLPGSLIQLDDQRRARCLDCADLAHLVYLPAGDTTLTRRATRHSRLAAVVVRWSTARKRYERQATLVEEQALERAEAESLSDADQREVRRARDAERRERLDARYVRDFAHAIRVRYPASPAGADVAIAEHACVKYSGRIGRSSAAKDLSDQAVDLAVRAHIHHRWTAYDELMMSGRDRSDARAAVRSEVDAIVQRWREAVPGHKKRRTGPRARAAMLQVDRQSPVEDG
ncbi:MAG: DUF2293 domain-containing protein [Chloroflexota bacterium]